MNKIFSLISISFILTACSVNQTIAGPLQTNPPYATSLQASATMKLPTSTPTITPRNTPTSTLTATPESAILMQDLTILTELPEGKQINGQLILLSISIDDSPSRIHTEQVHIVDANTGNERTISSNGLSASYPTVSRDGNWLAYQVGPSFPTVVENFDDIPNPWIDTYLVVEDIYGKEVFRYPFQEGWWSISQWFNNELIGIRRTGIHSNFISTFTIVNTINPFTGKVYDLPPDPEDIYDLIPEPYGDQIGEVVYNGDFTRRVYLSNPGDLILEDMETKVIIGSYPVAPGLPARWSPDGQYFVVNMQKWDSPNWYDDELYLISRDGQITQLTNFSSDHIEVDRINHYVWSPDGTNIAFLLQLKPGYQINPNLAIVEVSTGKLTIYNIESSFYNEADPVWSPDGNQLLITLPDGEKDSKVGIVDLNENWILEISKNMIPKGWLKYIEK